jgi:hypothetical protein
MQHPKKRLAQLDRLERVLTADIAAMAHLLDAPSRTRDQENLSRSWRAIVVSHSALRTLVKDVLRDTSDPRVVSPGGHRAIRDLNVAAREMKNHLRDWSSINGLIEQQMHSVSTPLFKDRIEPAAMPQVMDHITALFIDALHKVANPQNDTQSDTAEDAGLHLDIPLPMDQFSAMLGAAYRLCLAQRKARSLRFLDLGCGGGTKVLAARTCFETCHGLEYEARTVASGKKLLASLGAEHCKLMQGDAFAFADYGEYDVIYFFRPLRSTEDMIEMEARVLAQVQPGTILMVPAGGLLSPDIEAFGVHHVSGHVYVTGMQAHEAQTLHDDARTIGAAIPCHNRPIPSDPGLWDPILDVSRRNGHRI